MPGWAGRAHPRLNRASASSCLLLVFTRSSLLHEGQHYAWGVYYMVCVVRWSCCRNQTSVVSSKLNHPVGPGFNLRAMARRSSHRADARAVSAGRNNHFIALLCAQVHGRAARLPSLARSVAPSSFSFLFLFSFLSSLLTSFTLALARLALHFLLSTHTLTLRARCARSLDPIDSL